MKSFVRMWYIHRSFRKKAINQLYTKEGNNYKTPEKFPFSKNKTLKENFESAFKRKFDLQLQLSKSKHKKQ